MPKIKKGIEKIKVQRIEIECKYCNETFITLPSHHRIYCSRKCKDDDQRRGKYKKCTCGNEFYVSRGQEKANYGKFCSWSCSTKYHNPGKIKSSETIQKMKESGRKRRIREINERCGQIMPNYNPNAISVIREEAEKLGITDLMDAENGGEFQVCGYFVDGYSPTKNIVIEYYEPYHKKQVERDEQRKHEIIKELDCEFIEIREIE